MEVEITEQFQLKISNRYEAFGEFLTAGI